jgi:hypothetical protein
MLGFGFGSGDDYSLSWLRHVRTWKADLLPLHEPWRGDAPPRSMLVVMGEGNVVEERLVRTSDCATSADSARLLAEAVHKVAREAGGYPERLLVRDWAMASLLSTELDSHHVDVRVSAMRETERMIRHLATLLDEPIVARELVPVERWSHAAAQETGAFFAAAARFWRARPWERLGDGEALLARWRDMESIVVVTRPLGHGHVFTLFTHPRDYHDPFGNAQSAVWGVKFTSQDLLPRGIRDWQAAAPEWEVAGPGAFPLVLQDGPTISHGPSGGELHHLAAMLAGVAALAESGEASGPRLRFRDPETGLELRPEPESRHVLWAAMKRARTGCAEGPAAAPAAALSRNPVDPREQERVQRFEAHLRESGHRGWSAARHAANAKEWARFLATAAHVPSEAATEYDLRVFLYEWYPINTRADELWSRSLPTSLGRYFDYLAGHEEISYPWAKTVLRERRVYRDRLETAPLGDSRDDMGGETREWRAVLHADLDARLMLPARSFPGQHVGWDRPASRTVAALARELLRRWQIWRDEAIREGVTDLATLRETLVRRQREWERTPHPEHGASPLRVAAEAEPDRG